MTTTHSWFTRPMTLITLLAAGWLFFAACAKERSISPDKEAEHPGGGGGIDTTGTGGKDTTTNNGGGTGGAKDDFAQLPAGISVQTLTASAPAINKQYVVYTPSTYNTDKTKSWPVIIFLHGIGERGSNINSVKNVALPRKLAAEKDFQFDDRTAVQCR
ncbi:hypothetical protein MKQ68_25685 [Chitinophaga horti]|uniref:Esterase n=1 Tax=Chitinophaga horti TaxID=2920382 RepID=A0ABY6J580_9BACT|nr:hypothetical protein [Chitinophaga horti]UYQ93461.1 hypothetical protein MKQ68_25685 [Chitinophaga horti]